MVQYCVPNLLDHLKAYTKPDLNPYYDVIKAKYPGWTDPSGLMSGVDQETWEDGDMSLVPCRFYPDADLEGIDAGMKYTMFTLLLELLTDAPVTAVRAKYWADLYKQAFQQTLEGTEGFPAMIKFYTDDMLNAIKDPYRPRLVEHLNLLAEGMTAEAFSRELEGQAFTTLETYIKTRRNSFGVRPLFTVGCSIYDVDIADEVLAHPAIVKLENQALDLAILGNDIYSYTKEVLEGGAYHNYITIALGDHITGLRKNDRQGAINYTCQKFCEILADLEHGVKLLPSFGESEDFKVAKYIEILMDIVVGNIQYTIAAKRYRHCQTPDAPNWGHIVFDLDPL